MASPRVPIARRCSKSRRAPASLFLELDVFKQHEPPSDFLRRQPSLFSLRPSSSAWDWADVMNQPYFVKLAVFNSGGRKRKLHCA